MGPAHTQGEEVYTRGQGSWGSAWSFAHLGGEGLLGEQQDIGYGEQRDRELNKLDRRI